MAGENPILNINPAGLAHGKGTAQQERNATERQVARLDVVNIPRPGSVEDRQHCPALNGLAVVFPPLAAIEGWEGGMRTKLR